MTTHSSAPMVKTYLGVFGALALLTALTVGVAYMHLERTSAVVIALSIAGLKVSLITLFFMHLRFEKKGWIHWILYTALLLVAVLILLVLPDLTHLP